MKKLLLALALSLVTLGATPAFAAGAFDFLDPCIKARNEFSDQRQQIREKYAAVNASVGSMTYTPEFKVAWIKAKREQARPIFDMEVAPALARYKVTDMDAAFDAWFNDMLGSIAPDDLDSIINITFRQLRLFLALAETGTGWDQLDEGDHSMAKSMPQRIGAADFMKRFGCGAMTSCPQENFLERANRLRQRQRLPQAADLWTGKDFAFDHRLPP